MKFCIEIEEVYAKDIVVESDNWQDALMSAIKKSDKGQFIMLPEDMKEENVYVKGWPYSVCDKWSVDDVDEYVKKQPRWMSLNVTEDEKRKALVFMKEHVDKNTGFNWKSLEQALAAVVEKRKC